jgi:transcriptional regulator with XRE-family HTH domain
MSEDARKLATLGAAVRAMRAEQLLSLDDLALAAAVDPTRLAALEQGRLDPDFELLLRLAEAMDIRASAFIVEAEALSRSDAQPCPVADAPSEAMGRPVTVRWRRRRWSSPDKRNLEAGLTLTFAGSRLARCLTSWLWK